MIWLTLLLWLSCGSAKADSYAYLQMNLKNNASLNIVKAGTIKMAEDKANLYPKGKDLLRRLVLAEAEGEGLVGQALVANSLFNRIAIMTGSKGIGSPDNIGGGRYSGKRKALSTFYSGGNSTYPDRKSIDSTILASGQYEPISRGKKDGKRRIWEVGGEKDNALTPDQIADADKAIELAKNRGQLGAMLVKEGVDRANIGNLLDATGFRTGASFNDSSQNVNNTQFGGHVFNTAGNPSASQTAEAAALGEMPRKSDESVVADALRVVELPPGTPELESDSILDRDYIVRAGDTLSKIAREQGVDRKQIGGLRDAEKRGLIYPGDILTLPPEQKDRVSYPDPVSERIYNIMKPRN